MHQLFVRACIDGLRTLAALIIEIRFGSNIASVANEPIRSGKGVTAIICHKVSLQCRKRHRIVKIAELHLNCMNIDG
jgi:hypothetical protein